MAMESSAAVSLSRAVLPSKILFSPFSDQTHVDFYRCGRPRSALSLRSSTSHPSPPILAVPAHSGCAAALPTLEPPSQQPSSLLEELAQLKMQLKQKKKELKAQKKEEKKKLKIQVKEEKKKIKQKDPVEGKNKKMKKCSSESSSSSESSDDDCESMSMKVLRQEHLLLERMDDALAGHCLEDRVAGASVITEDDDRATPCRRASCSDQVLSSVERHGFKVCDPPEIKSSLDSSGATIAPLQKASQCANRIEVCTGGKCKKAGSEQLLLALRGHISSASDVEAVPCKCMGKCSMAMNVKVHKEDTNPQHHSQVRVEDANFITSHHFGLGRPPTGLPSILFNDRLREPAHLTASACGV